MMGELHLLCFISSLLASGLCKELIQVNVLYRHGDRAPIRVYPNDVHTADAWPRGLGMLTQLGEEQQIRLGQYLRGRYKNFLSKKFDYREMYVKSSDVDRTLVSAYSNLAGLYADNSSTLWQDGYIRWNPTPVHTVPGTYDSLLLMDRSCAKYDVLYQEKMTPILAKLNADFAKMGKLLMKWTGMNTSNITDLAHVRDTLYCERAHNMTWPAWATWRNMTCADNSYVPCHNRTVFDIISDISVYIHYNVAVTTPSLYKYHGGPLVMEMLDNMDRKSTDANNTPQFFMYSAHDSTVAAFLGALLASNRLMPHYTALVILETVKREGVVVIEVYYKNITDSDTVYQLNITGCEAPCTLSTLKQLFEGYRITDWDEACKNYKGLSKEEIEVISVCLAVVVCLCLATVICYTRRNRVKNQGYKRVDMELT